MSINISVRRNEEENHEIRVRKDIIANWVELTIVDNQEGRDKTIMLTGLEAQMIGSALLTLGKDVE